MSFTSCDGDGESMAVEGHQRRARPTAPGADPPPDRGKASEPDGDPPPAEDRDGRDDDGGDSPLLRSLREQVREINRLRRLM
ncbi:hypothetical protein ACFVIM_08785 [Streptomyces sp. NPDC057638]|uniref:hypothetical protein n=1 Tax=Streptomyces sp. NPDC057638 TaxID=3346190 RepID=UPI0036899048